MTSVAEKLGLKRQAKKTESFTWLFFPNTDVLEGTQKQLGLRISNVVEG